MIKTTVIHHSADFDGLFCREIARKFLPDATLIGWDYGDPVPTPDVVSSEDRLYMLDISVEGLMGHPKLIWIDHHKSAMEKFPPQIEGYRIDGVAACRLAWQWFDKHQKLYHPSAGSFAVPLPSKEDFIDRNVDEPLSVRLAGEYDIWDKRDSRAELFQHGLRSCPMTDDIWEELLEPRNLQNLVTQLLSQGEYLQYANTQANAAIIKRQGHDVEWERLKFLACNHAMFNSHLFTAGIKPEHDALMGFRWDGKEWHFSLYHAPGKEHHDLSLIAVKYGGGGHKGACGFRLNTLPFAHGL